jgi:hypothetical protein
VSSLSDWTLLFFVFSYMQQKVIAAKSREPTPTAKHIIQTILFDYEVDDYG